ncbi:hypothetical protein D3C80_2104880 [compost metagenome]
MGIREINILGRIHLGPDADDMHGIGPVKLFSGDIIHQCLGIRLQPVLNKPLIEALAVKSG